MQNASSTPKIAIIHVALYHGVTIAGCSTITIFSTAAGCSTAADFSAVSATQKVATEVPKTVKIAEKSNFLFMITPFFH
jgi:hypothetical protein